MCREAPDADGLPDVRSWGGTVGSCRARARTEDGRPDQNGVAAGEDTSVCLLNYKADGTPFWNQFFVAALRDADGTVVNYVGVQCEVNEVPVEEITERSKRMALMDI